jgi:hypothetical protein
MNTLGDTDTLRLYWWKAKPNFGDALSPLVVSHMTGRQVVHAQPAKADMVALGSLLQVIKRNVSEGREAAHRLTVWGAGLLHAVQSPGFVKYLDIAILRGPLTAKLLELRDTAFGDPALLINDVILFDGVSEDRIGIVPHYSMIDDPGLHAFVASDPAYVLIDPRNDATEVCKQIASCAQIYASSLHGLIVADAYGIPNVWITPGKLGRLKYHDYAASVGRKDMDTPVDLPDASPAGPITYTSGINDCRAALRARFPAHLKHTAVPAH